MEDTGKAPGPGKASQIAAEKAYDELAAERGIDEHGDEIPEVDDDESALEEVAESEVEEVNEVEEEEQPPEAEEAAEEIEEEASSETEPPSEELKPAPHTWRQEWKEAYDKIQDPTIRNAIHELTGHMNKAFSERMSEFAQAKRDTEGIKRALGGHADRLQRAGISPEVAISRALGWDDYMQRDPMKGWLDYGKALGIDTAKVLQEQQQETQYLTPTERMIQEQNAALAKRVEATERMTAQFQARQQQQTAQERQAQAYQVLQDFMNVKDDAGNYAHPHVDKVAPLMTRLIENGVVDDLESAYAMAAANNPEIAEAQAKARKAAQIRSSQKTAAKVRKASKSGIVGKGTAKGQPKAVRSTEDQVKAAYDKIANA